jgi:hypothetical protein
VFKAADKRPGNPLSNLTALSIDTSAETQFAREARSDRTHFSNDSQIFRRDRFQQQTHLPQLLPLNSDDQTIRILKSEVNSAPIKLLETI